MLKPTFMERKRPKFDDLLIKFFNYVFSTYTYLCMNGSTRARGLAYVQVAA